jgi:hypothetical protein
MKSYLQVAGVTLWDLQASSWGPLQIVYVTLNTTNNEITNEQVKFENELVEVQDFKKMTDHSRRI